MAKGRTGLSQDQRTAEEFSPDGEWTFLLVRTTGLLRVRNTMPEDIRTGLTSFTKTSDDTDVPVVDAHGRRRGHQPAKLLPPVTVRLRRAPRPSRQICSTRVPSSAWRRRNAVCCSPSFDRCTASSPMGPRKPVRGFSRLGWPGFRRAGHRCAACKAIPHTRGRRTGKRLLPDPACLLGTSYRVRVPSLPARPERHADTVVVRTVRRGVVVDRPDRQ